MPDPTRAVPSASAGSTPSAGRSVPDRAGPAPGPDDPPFRPPTHAGDLGRLSRYRVLKELGRGGMGAVFLGYDDHLRRRVALKVMLPRFAARPTAAERFLREARAAAAVRSDHVVTLFEVDEDNGIPFIAMEYLQGMSLEQHLRQAGAVTIPQAIQIGRETALGLAAAHEKGLIHRDVKPANLWLEAPNGRVKLLDFGLARHEEEQTTADASVSLSGLPIDATEQLTKTGAVLGTPAYMSPEQGRGHKLDPRSDLFSLGGVLYRLLTGRLPFPGQNQTEVLLKLAMDDPPPVRELNPAAPAPLAALVHRLLAKDPAHRPESARAMVAVLDGLSGPVAGSGPQVVYVPLAVEAQAESIWEQIEEPPTAVEEAPPRPKPKPGPRWPAVAVLSLLGLLMVAGSVWMGMKVFRRPPVPEPPPDDPKPVATTTPPETHKKKEPPARRPFVPDDLPGWAAGPGDVITEWVDGEPAFHVTRQNGRLTTEQPYTDFHLSLEFRTPPAGAPGSLGNIQHHIAPLNEYGLNFALVPDIWGKAFVWNDRGAVRSGAVRDGRIVPRDDDPTGAGLHPPWSRVKPPGEWNRADLVCLGDTFLHAVNGRVLCVGAGVRFNGKPLTAGRVQLQGGPDMVVRAARIDPIAALPEAFGGPKGPFFTGRDLAGWETANRKGMWDVRDGAVVATVTGPLAKMGAKAKSLYSTATYRDFELSFQVRLKGGKGWCGVSFRSAVPGPKTDFPGGKWAWGPKGDTLQVAGEEDEDEMGFPAKAAPEPRPGVSRDAFHRVVLRCLGRRVTVTVDGQVWHDKVLDRLPDAGVIGWRVGGTDTEEVTYRDVRFTEFPPPADPDRKADREAALWVLEKGGEVRIDWNKDPTPRDALPAGPFRLTGVGLTSPGYRVTDADLARFAGCPDVEAYTFWHAGLTDAGLKALAAFPHAGRVRYLVAEARAVTDAGLKELAGMTSLRHLGLKNTRVTDDGLPSLDTHSRLDSVHIGGTQATEAGVRRLAAALPGCSITWTGGVLRQAEVERKAAEALNPYADLRLDLGAGRMVDVSAGVSLPKEPFVVRAIVFRPGRPEVAPGYVGKELVAVARALSRLERIEDTVFQLPVSEDEYARLVDAAPTLTHLIMRPWLTEKNLAAADRLPGLKVVSFEASAAGDDQLVLLAKHRLPDHLVLLGLGKSGKVTARGWDALAGLPVSRLTLGAPAELPAQAWARTAKMPRLDRLTVWIATVRKEALAEVGKSATLRALDVWETPLTDDDLAGLTGAGLRYVGLRGTKLSEGGAKALADRLPRCLVESHGKTFGPTEPAADRARRAAEGLRKHTVTLVVRLPDGTGRTVAEEEALPAGPFAVTGVDLQGRAYPAGFVADTLLPALADLPELTALANLHQSLRLTPADLARLADAPQAARLTALTIPVPLTPTAPDTLRPFPKLTRLTADAADADDALLVRLQELPGVTELGLRGLGKSGKVGPAGLEAVAQLPLRQLTLQHVNLSADDFARLADRLPNLTYLDLRYTAGAEALLPAAARLPRLATLGLNDTPVADAGLKLLAGAKSLKRVYLHKTRVTADGVAELKKALPDCQVDWDGPAGK